MRKCPVGSKGRKSSFHFCRLSELKKACRKVVGYSDEQDAVTSGHSRLQDTFSVTLVDRSDVMPGDFDIVFTYGTQLGHGRQ